MFDNESSSVSRKNQYSDKISSKSVNFNYHVNLLVTLDSHELVDFVLVAQ